MKTRRIIAAAVLLLLAGCAYTTHNALPPHIRTVAVPVFKNKTFANDYTRRIEVDVTEAVRNAFIQAGELKLAGREDADLILEGSVTKLDREVLRNNRFGDPAEVRMAIHARISIYDVKEAKYLEKDLAVSNLDKKSESGVYSIRRGENEGQGMQQAFDDLGRVIARRVTERW